MSEIALDTTQLFTSKLERKASSEEDGEKGEYKGYDVRISLVLAGPKWLIAFCDYSAFKSAKENNGFLFSASYSFSMSYPEGLDEERRRQACLEIAGKQVWYMFREHFSFINSQAGLGVPALPTEPNIISLSESVSFKDFDAPGQASDV